MVLIEGILATLVATSTVVVAEPPKKLAAGSQGWFTPGLLLQAWYFVSDTDATTSTFRLRRAEIKVQGDIIPDFFGYAVMIDAARVLEQRDTTFTLESGETLTIKQPPGGSSPLQDLFVTLKGQYIEASIGQFKTPVSYEGYIGSSKTLFPERALTSITYGDRRDIGLRLTKSFKYFMYSAGIFNGGGQNVLDTNNSKDLAIRAEIYPLEGLLFGGCLLTTIGKTDESGSKERYEGDVRFERFGVILQGEYIRAVDVGRNANRTTGHGYYVAGAFKPLEPLQLGLRYGRLDPNVDADADPTMTGGRDEAAHYEGMVTYFFSKFEARLQLALARFEYDQRTDATEAVLSAQASY